MAKTKTCPSCGTKVPLETEHCPNCPASFPSFEAAPLASHARRGPANPAVYLLLVVCVCILGWKLLSGTLNYVSKEITTPPVPADAPDSRVQTITLPGPSKITAAPPEEDEEPVPVVVNHEAPRKKQAVVSEWKLRGSVYDLISLKPVARASLAFKDLRTARSIETVTDLNGRYRLTVPALAGRGYVAQLHAPGYASSYLNPDIDNVASKPEPDRREMAAELNHSLNGAYTVQAHDSDPWVTDFYLAPKL